MCSGAGIWLTNMVYSAFASSPSAFQSCCLWPVITSSKAAMHISFKLDEQANAWSFKSSITFLRGLLIWKAKIWTASKNRNCHMFLYPAVSILHVLYELWYRTKGSSTTYTQTYLQRSIKSNFFLPSSFRKETKSEWWKRRWSIADANRF